jgi:tetratricopeptide (TPR) repeat protein
VTYHFNLANSYYESEQIEFALNAYLDALDIEPDYVPAINNLAEIYELAGEQEKARELFEYITRLEPDKALAYLNLGNHFLRHNNTVKAGSSYKQAISLDPACYEAYNNIGFILKHLGKYQEAIPYFRNCLEIKSDYEPARKDLEACKQAIQNT